MEKYEVCKNKRTVERLIDKSKALFNDAIKELMDPGTIAAWDSDTLDLYRNMMALFDETCSMSISMAEQLDEQSHMLMDLTNEMEVLEKQNEEILRILKTKD